MAIQFKSEEQRKLEKEAKAPKTKLQKAQRIFFISAIVATAILLLYFIVTFSPTVVIAPFATFWIMVIVIPSVVSVGFIWLNEGYKSFAKKMTDLLGKSTIALKDAINVLAKSLPYVGTIMLLIIATYAVLSFINYKKDTTVKKYFYHFIIAGIMFILGLLFMILGLVFLPKLYN